MTPAEQVEALGMNFADAEALAIDVLGNQRAALQDVISTIADAVGYGLDGQSSELTRITRKLKATATRKVNGNQATLEEVTTKLLAAVDARLDEQSVALNQFQASEQASLGTQPGTVTDSTVQQALLAYYTSLGETGYTAIKWSNQFSGGLWNNFPPPELGNWTDFIAKWITVPAQIEKCQPRNTIEVYVRAPFCVTNSSGEKLTISSHALDVNMLNSRGHSKGRIYRVTHETASPDHALQTSNDICRVLNSPNTYVVLSDEDALGLDCLLFLPRFGGGPCDWYWGIGNFVAEVGPDEYWLDKVHPGFWYQCDALITPDLPPNGNGDDTNVVRPQPPYIPADDIECCDNPVDLDQPLAWRFSRHANLYRYSSAKFAGIPQAANVNSVSDLVRLREDVENWIGDDIKRAGEGSIEAYISDSGSDWEKKLFDYPVERQTRVGVDDDKPPPGDIPLLE